MPQVFGSAPLVSLCFILLIVNLVFRVVRHGCKMATDHSGSNMCPVHLQWEKNRGIISACNMSLLLDLTQLRLLGQEDCIEKGLCLFGML